jgi:hypothetical protein
VGTENGALTLGKPKLHFCTLIPKF